MKKFSSKFGVSKKAFTIIELIVVIAIIAILAGIVLNNVTKYNNKGKISAIKGNLATLRVVGLKYFETNGNYTSFCGTNPLPSISAAITKAGGTMTCFNSAVVGGCLGLTNKWVVISTLPDGTSWCVDYLGSAKAWVSGGPNGCDCSSSPMSPV